MVGSMHSLTCTVTGAERLNATLIYQWYRNSETLSDETMETLSFQSLVISDAGSYTCQATVTSSLLSGTITTSSTNSIDVTLICKSLTKLMFN
jgi:hypothetical protein